MPQANRLTRLWNRLLRRGWITPALFMIVAIALIAVVRYANELPLIPAVATLCVGGLGYYFFNSQYQAKQAEERIREHYRFLLDFREDRQVGWQAVQMWYKGDAECDRCKYRKLLVSWLLDMQQDEDMERSERPSDTACSQFRVISLLIQHFGIAIEQRWLRHDEGFDHFYCHWRIILVPVCQLIRAEYQERLKKFDGAIARGQYPLNPNIERIINYDATIDNRCKSLCPFDEGSNPIVPRSNK